jgi:hypothetical protein
MVSEYTVDGAMRSKADTFRQVLEHPERTIVTGLHLHAGEDSKLTPLHGFTERNDAKAA